MLNQLIKLIFPVFVLAIVIPGCTPPLHRAIQQGDDARVSSLLARGADINTRHWGDTPLHAAVQRGHCKIVQLLIDKGADVNVKDGKWGWTPLQLAVRFGHDEREIVKLLVARGAYVDARTPYVPYRDRASSNRASLLEFQGLPYWNAWWETPLHIAASLGQREVAEVLLANGADVNAKDSYSSTPLHRAALFGYNDVVELLIMWNADVNAKDEDGQTPLDRAAEETVDLLRDNGAKGRFESQGTRD